MWFRWINKPPPSACLLTFTGHNAEVIGCAYLPDGRRVLSASWDGTLKLWDAETGEEMATLRGHAGSVYACALSPDGQQVISGGHDCTIRIWDVATESELRVLRGHEYLLEACVFTPDGKRIISEDQDRVLKLWDAQIGTELASVKRESRAYVTTTLAPDLTLRVFGNEGEDFPVEFPIFEQLLRDGTTRKFPFLKGTDCSPDGQYLLSHGVNALRIWDASTGAKLAGSRASPINGCAFSPDSKRIATGSADQTITIWDGEPKPTELSPELKAMWRGASPFNLVPLSTLRGHSGDVSDCVFSPDSKSILSSSYDGTLKLWDADPKPEVEPAHRSEIKACSLSPDRLRAISAAPGELKIWNTATADVEATVDLPGHVWQATYAPDGARIITLSNDLLQVRDLDGNEIAYIANQGWFTFSPDARFAFSMTREGRALTVWQTASGEIVKQLEDAVGHAAFSPDGRHIATAGWRQVKLWHAETGNQFTTLGSYLRGANDEAYRNTLAGRTCAFSPDGRWLAASDECVLKLWDLTTLQESWFRGEYLAITRLEFAPDGRRIVSSGMEFDIRLWDVERRIELARFEQRVKWVFSHDGRYLVSSGRDGTLKLCDAATGRELLEMRGHSGLVTHLSLSPDGRRIISAGEDGLVCIWDVMSGRRAGTFYAEGSVISLDTDGSVFVFGTSQGVVSVLHLQN